VPAAKRLTILVTGACGVTSRSVVRSLKQSSVFGDSRFVGTDVLYNLYGLHEGLYDVVYEAPWANEAGYRDAIETVLRRERVDAAVVIPEPEVVHWSRAPFDVPALLPPPAFAAAALSKQRVYELLAGTDLVPPHQVAAREALERGEAAVELAYPLWTRDAAEGTTSGKGSFKAESYRQLRAWLEVNPSIPAFMLSGYLPGRNFGCFLLYDDDRLLKAGVTERLGYFMSGSSVSGVTGNAAIGRLVYDETVVRRADVAVRTICAVTGEPMRGVVVVDLRESQSGQACVTEVNVKHAATTSLLASAGVNISEFQLLCALGRHDEIAPGVQMRFPPGNRFLRDIDGPPIYVKRTRQPASANGDGRSRTRAKSPAPDGVVHVGGPNVGDRERFLARVNDLLDRRWLTNHGPFVREFEREVAALCGVRNCVAMCNGTVALEIAIRALGLTGEVIVPSFTFVATAHALQWQEITPVFADVDPRTHTIDPASVERLITPRTSGIIGVHLWGRACDVEGLQRLAERHDLKLMFDAAHAFRCSHRRRMVGGFGQAEVLSFHATKVLNTFEGGAILTNDDTLAEKARLMSNFGFAGVDNVTYLGTNGKMSEIAAAMGLTLLESLDEHIAINRRNYEAYRRALRGAPGLHVVEYDDRELNNYHYVIVEVDETGAGVSRDQLVAMLWDNGVRARRYFYPGCHRMEPYRSYFPNAGLVLPHTEMLTERVLALPTGSTVDEAVVARICRLIRSKVGRGRPPQVGVAERRLGVAGAAATRA